MLRTAWAQLSQRLNALANWHYFKLAVFIACALPAVLLLWKTFWPSPFVDATFGGLGADPTKTFLHETGEDALGILLGTLAITPIRRVFKVNGIQKVRKMVGLWSFFYAFCHVTLYLTLDQLCYSLETCEFQAIVDDVLKRKFIFVGMVSFTILAVLAITSTSGWVRRLKKKWQTLHRLVYVAGIAGVIHFIWIQKSDIGEPLMWAGWLTLVLLIRVYFAIQKRRKARFLPTQA